MSLTRVDPRDVYFTFSRLRPKFSCGRRIEDTLNSILNGELRAEDLPPISVLFDSATGHLFSLNNRRLYVFKALVAAGKLKTIPVRIKSVPQTKRMKEKYSAEKCVKQARLMLEKEALEALGSDNEAEGVNSDREGDDEDTSDDDGGDELKERASKKKKQKKDNSSSAAAAHHESKVGGGEEKKKHEEEVQKQPHPPKYIKPQRNMDDWTDEEDNGAAKGGKNKKGTRKK